MMPLSVAVSEHEPRRLPDVAAALARMGDTKLVDYDGWRLDRSISPNHMGLPPRTSPSVRHHARAGRLSERGAVAAIADGPFKWQIVPIEIQGRKSTVLLDTDEYPKADISPEGLAKLKPAFKKDGTVTAGNASGINDGAAAVVMMEAAAAAKAGLKPLARLVAYAVAGVDPSIMGTGPIPAVKLALKRAGLAVKDIDVIESNEAFAAQALCVTKSLDFDPAKVNPNGGAVALGHPLGATGAILTVKCLYELERTGKRYELVTMCIGGGQGIAGIFERL